MPPELLVDAIYTVKPGDAIGMRILQIRSIVVTVQYSYSMDVIYRYVVGG